MSHPFDTLLLAAADRAAGEATCPSCRELVSDMRLVHDRHGDVCGCEDCRCPLCLSPAVDGFCVRCAEEAECDAATSDPAAEDGGPLPFEHGWDQGVASLSVAVLS